MVFQFHQCIFHKLQKKTSNRFDCLAKVTEFTALTGPTGATAFIAAGCLSMATNAKHFVNALTYHEWSKILFWFQCGKKHTQRANICKSRPDLMNLLEVCVAALLWQACTWNMAARSSLLCPKIHSRAVFRDGFSDRNRHKYSSFCTFLRIWMKTNQIERSQLRLQKRKPMAPHQRSSALEPPTSRHKGSSAWWHRWQSWCLAPKSKTWASKQ